jgi:POT family proton-dependent oligopeptide transporter
MFHRIRQHLHQHPKELFILALSELCERFAFWGVGFMLVLYLVGYYHFENAKATEIYGLFSGFATFLPLIGGYVADRWNYQAPLFIGALVNALGCFMLATGLAYLLFPALAIIAAGYGIFTPSILTVLGHTYRDKPRLRETGFTIYYAAINVGVFLALIILGFISQQVSWHAAFFVAGIVQLLGIIPIIWYLCKHKETYRSLQELQWKSRGDVRKLKKEDKDRIKVIVTLSLFSILFWIAYNQGFSSMSLFAKNDTARTIAGWEVPPSWILSSEALFLIVLAPLLARLYHVLQKKNLDPSPSLKTSYSLFAMALCFLVMMVGSYTIPNHAETAAVNPGYPIFAFFLMAVGEMLLAPIGLSLVTQLSPRFLTAFFVGFWYLCVGVAFYLGGVVAGWMDKVGGLFHFFGIFVVLTLIPAVILFFLSKKLTEMSHGKVDVPPPRDAGL